MHIPNVWKSCMGCGRTIRVADVGEAWCPDCFGATFIVQPDGTVNRRPDRLHRGQPIRARQVTSHDEPSRRSVTRVVIEPSTGINLIAAERRRQVAKGWTPEHDDEHDNGELATAAARYAEAAGRWQPDERTGTDIARTPMNWPWHPKHWKPTGDPIRDLVKAGALIAAEIDRLKRLRKQRKGTI